MLPNLSIPVPQKKYSPKFIQELGPKSILADADQTIPEFDEPVPALAFQQFS